MIYCLNYHHLELFSRSRIQTDFPDGDEKHISDIKATHCWIAHLCLYTQDKQRISKKKADRIWSAEHFIFTILRLKNSIMRERFYHLIFSLQLLVCNFLAGNFFFLGIIRKKVSFGLWKCIFLYIERLIQDYEESERPLLLKYGRKGNNTGSLRAASSCKLFLCHVVQSEILAHTIIATLPSDPYIPSLYTKNANGLLSLPYTIQICKKRLSSQLSTTSAHS